MFGQYGIVLYICIAIQRKRRGGRVVEGSSLLNCRTAQSGTAGSNPVLSSNSSGRGAARLAHLLWEQGVAGSNPAAPTFLSQYMNTQGPVAQPDRATAF